MFFSYTDLTQYWFTNSTPCDGYKLLAWGYRIDERGLTEIGNESVGESR